MPLDAFKNFAKGTLSTGYNNSATSIVLTTGHGARFPSVPFNASWWNATDYPDPSDDPNVEIVRVTGIASDTFTVTRGQEGIAATTKNDAGKTYKLVAALTAKTLNSDFPSLAPASDIMHGNPWPATLIARYDEDFLSGINQYAAGSAGGSGATATATSGNAPGHPGLAVLITGTSGAGSARLLSNASIIFGGGVAYDIYMRVKSAALPDGTNTYIFSAGFVDNATIEASDGAYFFVSQASGNWEAKTANNGSRTPASGGTGVALAADTWYDIWVAVNGAGTLASFYVFSAGAWILIGTCATNIPTGASRETAHGFFIGQTAGTSSRTWTIDKVLLLVS